jgi:hypothetical protein
MFLVKLTKNNETEDQVMEEIYNDYTKPNNVNISI